MSVMVTIVLLNEATMCAMPVWTFLLPFALMILIGSTTAFGSSERFSSFFGSAGAPAAAASFLAPFGALTLAAFGGLRQRREQQPREFRRRPQQGSQPRRERRAGFRRRERQLSGPRVSWDQAYAEKR